MKRAERLFHLHKALEEGPEVLNATEWALRFGVNTRTVRRDLAFLRKESHQQLVFDHKLKGYRYRKPKSPGVQDKQKKWTRLLTLIHRISAQPGQTAQQLADATGRAPRTIFRDLADLQDAGFPLYNDDGYRFASDAFLRPINLNGEEMFSLFVAARFLEAQDSSELGLKARQALEKLLRAISEQRRPDLGEMRDNIQVAEPSEDTGASLLGQVHEALAAGCQVELSYQGSKDPAPRARRVDPIGLFCFRQVWYLHAYDHHRSGLRNFRLSRISELSLLEEAVEYDPKLQLENATYHRWDLGKGEPREVVLKVTPELGRWLEENPAHPSQRLEEESARFSVRSPVEMARWVASLYGVEVLEPVELREEMARIAEEMRRTYLPSSF